MSNIRRIIFATAALTAAFIQGCGCSDSKKNYPSSPPPTQTYTVTGTAAKGILRSFQVTAHTFDSGLLNPTPIASSNTNGFGAYSLSIPQTYINQPLLFRVTPNPTGSTMICDLSAGCGSGVNFGDAQEISDTNFRLDSVVTATSNNSVSNITLLTSLAAQLAQEAIAQGASVAQIQAAIAESNSRVANRFGLTGDLTTMPVIDLTSPTAVTAVLNAGNTQQVQYAALNSAIAQAAQADNNLLGFVAALNSFITYFVEGGVAGNTSDATETSLADILAAARTILTEVQEGLPQASSSLVAMLQNLLAEQQLAENEEPDNRDTGTPSTGAGDSDLQKAKNMVADLRDFAASIGESTLEGGANVEAISDEFAMQLEAAEMATSGPAGYLLEALAIASAAIDDANRAYDDNSELTSYVSATGVTVAISLTEGDPTFAVDQAIPVESDNGTLPVEVVLSAQNGLTVTESSGQGTSTVNADGDYRVEGSASSDDLILTVKEGSHMLLTDMVHEESDAEMDSSSSQSAEAFDLRLYVTLAQIPAQGSDPVTLDGSLTATLADLMVENTDSPNGETTDLSLGAVSLQFSGKVSNTTGESFNFSLSIDGDATGLSFVDGVSGDSESEDNYADVTASLAFTANLTSIPSAVSVAYSVQRTGLESASNSLIVKYPGKMFRFNMNLDEGEPDGSLTVINQDAAVLTLSEITEGGESLLDGEIKVNGTKHADIEERNPGVIVITYSDDSVESL